MLQVRQNKLLGQKRIHPIHETEILFEAFNVLELKTDDPVQASAMQTGSEEPELQISQNYNCARRLL